MKGFVVDASIALAWFFIDEATPSIMALLDRLEDETAYVPAIWPLELGNVLLNAEKRKRTTYAEIIQFLNLLKNVNINVDNEAIPNRLDELLSLAHAEKLTTYDASYLELALRLGVPLATKDNDLFSAATRLGVNCLK